MLLLIAGVALVLPKAPDASPGLDRSPPPSYAPVSVQAGQGAQGLTLCGRVLDPTGKPVPDAEVMLAASAQRSLSSATCPVCSEPLLQCEARETSLAVLDHLTAHHGGLAPAVTVRTGSSGEFRFEKLAGVSFTVWARSATLGTAVRERAAPGDPVELVLPALRSVAGLVTDDAGAPVSGATVYAVASRLGFSREAVSDGKGRFEVRGLGEGPFFVLATAAGYLPARRHRVEAGPLPITLALSRPRRLEVSVKSDGKPVAGNVLVTANHLRRQAVATGGQAAFDGLFSDEVTVAASLGDRASPPQVVTLTAPVTRVALELRAGGKLFVSVVDEADEPVPSPRLVLFADGREEGGDERVAQTGELVQFGPLVPGGYQLWVEAKGFKAQRMPVVVGRGESTVEVSMAKAVVISGRVLDEYDRPAPGIAVLVNPIGDSVQSDEQGRFLAEVPSPGSYSLHAHHSDWGGGQVTVSAPAQNVELRLAPQAGVQVQVQVGGRRVEGAQASVWQERAGSFRSDRPSGADGVVLLRGLPPGTYSLIAEHPDYLSSTRYDVTVVDGQLSKVTAELRPGGRVSGTVVDERGAPVQQAAVSVIPSRGATPVNTDAEGHFEISPLVPGAEYRVAVNHLAYEPEAPAQATVDGEPITITLKRRSLVRGRVVAQDGSALTHFNVNEHVVDSADGRFELPLSTVEGELIVSVDAPGFEPEVVDRPLTADLGDISLRRQDVLEGTVVDRGGATVAGAVVTCSSCEQSAMSDEQGHFRIARPTFAQATLLARKGRLSGSQRVSRRGESVRIQIAGGTRLSGRVFAPTGQPAAGVELEISGDEEPIAVVTSLDGSYSVELTPGGYRFRVSSPGMNLNDQGYAREDLERLILAEVSGAEQRLDFGPAPGTGSLTVRLPARRGRALWLFRGDPPPLGVLTPLMFDRVGYGQMFSTLEGQSVVFNGLPPGSYTLLSPGPDGLPNGTQPNTQRVDIAGPTEIALVR